MALRLATHSGSPAEISDEDLQQLRTTFRGPVLSPGSDGYEEARIVQNASFDCRPGMIVRCSGTADVMDAVRAAAERGLLTAVRSGGHSVAGHCTCDDGLMIDLSQMRGVWVDPERRRIRVQGGATWGDVDRESQQFGLAVPGGVVSTTGVAGLTLGGGIGWLHRKWGLACDALRAVEMVTASGERVRASAEENEELFWGVRGAGANFGVATAFEFEAYPLGPIVMCVAAMYAMEDADGVFDAWREWSGDAPDEITSRALFWTLPDDEAFPPEARGREVLIIGAVHAGPAEEGERALQPLREWGDPLVDLSGPMPYRMFQAAFDPFFPKGEMGSYWKSVFLGALDDDVTGMVLRRSRERPTGVTLVHVPLMGGATSRVAAGETAFGDRSAPYMLSVDGNWWDPDDRERVTAWVRETVSEVEGLPASRGTYLNFDGEAAGGTDELVRSAFGDNFERLQALKQRYDPDNLFRLNNNVAPPS